MMKIKDEMYNLSDKHFRNIIWIIPTIKQLKLNWVHYLKNDYDLTYRFTFAAEIEKLFMWNSLAL